MKKIYSLRLLPILVLGIAGCDQGKDLVNPTEGTEYGITITFSWTSSNHPSGLGSYPSGAHFSPVIGSVHKIGSEFYRTGNMASAGVKLMAETGGTSTLSKELNEQVAQGAVYDTFIGSGNGATGELKVTNIKATDEFHLVSLVTMLAPSPDWFIAVDNVDLKDAFGNWKETISVEMHGYDAGTDSGDTFTSANSATNPPEDITRFKDANDIVFASVTFRKNNIL